jgi:transcriptional regulator with XRE-family HTH domain
MADHHAFSKRLQTACDNNVNVPPYGKGLQTWLSKRLGVSQEAVRRWFYAESRPRPQLLSQLSAVLEVDESWLALGTTNASKSSKRQAYSDKADGAAYVCFGLLRAAGYACAFADNNDPFDFHAIKKGEHFFLSAAAARPKSKNIYITHASNFEKASHLSVLFHESGAFEVVQLPWSLIQRAGRLTSENWELELRAAGDGSYTLDEVVLDRLEGSCDILNVKPEGEST